jgi:hypothetical protein
MITVLDSAFDRDSRGVLDYEHNDSSFFNCQSAATAGRRNSALIQFICPVARSITR